MTQPNDATHYADCWRDHHECWKAEYKRQSEAVNRARFKLTAIERAGRERGWR